MFISVCSSRKPCARASPAYSPEKGVPGIRCRPQGISKCTVWCRHRGPAPRRKGVEHLLGDAPPEGFGALHPDVGAEGAAVVPGCRGGEVACLADRGPRRTAAPVLGPDVDPDELGGGSRRVALGEPARVGRVGRVLRAHAGRGHHLAVVHGHQQEVPGMTPRAPSASAGAAGRTVGEGRVALVIGVPFAEGSGGPWGGQAGPGAVHVCCRDGPSTRQAAAVESTQASPRPVNTPWGQSSWSVTRREPGSRRRRRRAPSTGVTGSCSEAVSRTGGACGLPSRAPWTGSWCQEAQAEASLPVSTGWGSSRRTRREVGHHTLRCGPGPVRARAGTRGCRPRDPPGVRCGPAPGTRRGRTRPGRSRPRGGRRVPHAPAGRRHRRGRCRRRDRSAGRAGRSRRRTPRADAAPPVPGG